MFSIKVHPYQLHFKKPAGTSRGVLHERNIRFIEFHSPNFTSWGEAGTLPDLSIDDVPEYDGKLSKTVQRLNQQYAELLNLPFEELLDILDLSAFPSIAFALESAILGWTTKKEATIFNSAFVTGEASIPINGLVWMDNSPNMLMQVEEKIAQGYACIKLKIGALDFDEECRLLETIRKKYNAFAIEMRVDANGAFAPDTALEQLKELQRFDLHSIEQPVKQGQWEVMEELCAKSSLPIALDEELIGIDPCSDGAIMLKKIKPQFIILKPSLLGGFTRCKQWITASQQLNIGYWITSALESNIGLNAIAQFTSTLQVNIPQGLGTGQLYTNNISSPLHIANGALHYIQNKKWDWKIITTSAEQ
jgi:o-succinylbenzoate synthase